mgnify:CR=1 FL=1
MRCTAMRCDVMQHDGDALCARPWTTSPPASSIIATRASANATELSSPSKSYSEIVKWSAWPLWLRGAGHVSSYQEGHALPFRTNPRCTCFGTQYRPLAHQPQNFVFAGCWQSEHDRSRAQS